MSTISKGLNPTSFPLRASLLLSKIIRLKNEILVLS